jgi:ADP-ribose pyrophosphatase YjhB (NUDIX family)
MALARDTHCSFCGTAYPGPLSYPRTCPNCSTQVWANPLPVSIALVPVRDGAREGLLVVKRAIEPRQGFLALVGGFLEEHETWQQGAARETREETGVLVDPSSLQPFWFASSNPKPNRVLLFGVAAPLDASALPPFTTTNETTERGLVFGPEGLDALFAFPLHVEALRRYFESRGVTGPHDYVQR